MMAEEGTQQLPYVRETVLKKRKVNEDWAIKNRERKAAKRQRRRDDGKGAIKRPEDFVREFRNKELDFVRMRTRLKVRKLPPAESLSSKLIFAIRIPCTTDLHPHMRKILRKLRLTQVLTGVFLKASEATMKRLLVVEPFVTYGFPNLKNVKELIYKKGRGFLDKEPFPLTSNDLIEKALGEHGIICLEDVVHEIATVGPHFKEASNFLMPFKLKCPERRLQMKKKPYKDGGDSGNRTLAAKYESLGGEVKWMGKPDKVIYTSAMSLAGVSNAHECITVGDSLHHDIKGANAARVASAFITGGIHAAELGLDEIGETAGDDAIDSLCLMHGSYPTYVLPSFTW
ncbi:hypothetical protein E2562_037962 [Oryza meyeriana var. granulata]|uniref:Ribosomal protein L30 ferredoxin-like fold domain-containing protein n=1 Tax=Oryza meyeriana var. granulata TaxID=110450 RepID=A0A6G1CMT3_9ORYZ|nr:hypothetical protein E2562_037962 [Oryza meyeriana var. granulata]